MWVDFILDLFLYKICVNSSSTNHYSLSDTVLEYWFFYLVRCIMFSTYIVISDMKQHGCEIKGIKITEHYEKKTVTNVI